MHLLLLPLLFVACVLHAQARPIFLPEGVRVEGVTHVRGAIFLAADVISGNILILDAESAVLGTVVRVPPGRFSIGLFSDGVDTVYAAGAGPFFPDQEVSAIGTINAYKISTGEEIASCVVPRARFINDVTVNSKFAYFTDSRKPVLYRQAIGSFSRCTFKRIRFFGSVFDFDRGQTAMNGIIAYEDGLLVAHSGLGAVYFVDEKNKYEVTPVLEPGSVPGADGLDVRRINGSILLFIAQNRLNVISAYRLAIDKKTRVVTAEFERRFSRPFFANPTTVAVSSKFIVVPSFNFSTPVGVTPPSPFNVGTIEVTPMTFA